MIFREAASSAAIVRFMIITSGLWSQGGVGGA
jgi:hypothetical protein